MKNRIQSISKKTQNLPDVLYLSENVKNRRILLNIKQEEIAEAIGVDVKTYRHWENGKTVPTNIASLYKLCICLDCEIDFLFGKISLPNKADTDISDYTGLTLDAIEKLHELKEENLCFDDKIRNYALREAVFGFLDDLILYKHLIPIAVTYNRFVFAENKTNYYIVDNNGNPADIFQEGDAAYLLFTRVIEKFLNDMKNIVSKWRKTK